MATNERTVMRRVIWKFQLHIMERQQVFMPVPATPLCVQMQGERPCLWVEVDPNNPMGNVELTIVGTGQVVPEGSRYVNTFLMNDGVLVFHVYEVRHGQG